MTEFTPARLAELRGVAELLSGSTFAATLDDYSNVGRVAFYPLTDELMCSRMRVVAFFENLPETVLALIDALEAKTAEVEDLRAWKKRVIEQVRDTTTGQPSPPDTDYGELIDRLKRERDEARMAASAEADHADELQARNAELARERDEAHNRKRAAERPMIRQLERAEKAEAALERVKALPLMQGHEEAHKECCGGKGYCAQCYGQWPCATIQAIEGTNA